MSTVDALISAAVNRAIYWGNAASSHASSAVDEASVRPFRAYVRGGPHLYSKIPELPSCDNLSAPDALRQQLEGMLNSFFSDFFSSNDAYSVAAAWVLDALTTNDPKLPGNGVDVIWQRSHTHLQPLGIGVDGLQVPVEAQTAHRLPDNAVIAHAKAYVQSMTAAELWQHAAAARLRDLRTSAIVAIGEYITALVNADTISVNAQTKLAEARQRVRQAGANWYAAQYAAMGEEAERRIAEMRAFTGLDFAQHSHYVHQIETKVNAAVRAAEAVAKVAQAAQSSASAVISASQVQF